MDSRGDPKGGISVILSAQENGHDLLMHPERRITLNEGKTTVTIGRASKVQAKGLVPASDNLWYDSPVMSRNHAELVGDVGAKTVSIRDLGSMHGTFLNDESIPPHTLQALKCGDKVRFGVGIDRGHDRYIPTTVNVELRFPSTPMPATFEVPDASESEMDDVESIYDGDSDSGFLDESVAPVTKIDLTNDDVLTRDDDKLASGPDYVDLTSPIRQPSPEVPPPLRPFDVDQLAPAVDAHGAGSNSDDVGSGSDLDSSSDDVSLRLSDGEVETDPEESEMDNDVDSDAGVIDRNGDDIDLAMDEALADDYNVEDDFDSDNDFDQERDLYNTVFDDDDDDEASHWDPADSEDEDSDDSADASGEEDDDDEADSHYPARIPTPLVEDAPLSVDVAVEPVEPVHETTVDVIVQPFTQPPVAQPVPAISVTVREPSPSDAALVRSIRPLPAAQTQSNEPPTLAPAPAYKSHEFFVAREENRSKAADYDQAECTNPVSGHVGRSLCPSTPDSSPNPGLIPDLGSSPPQQPEAEPQCHLPPATTFLANNIALAELSPLLMSGQRFLNSPLPDDHVANAFPAYEDEAMMTSAVTYQMSKRSAKARLAAQVATGGGAIETGPTVVPPIPIGAAPGPVVAAAASSPTAGGLRPNRLSICHLVEQQPKASTPPAAAAVAPAAAAPLKRKAADISDVTREELEAWASKDGDEVRGSTPVCIKATTEPAGRQDNTAAAAAPAVREASVVSGEVEMVDVLPDRRPVALPSPPPSEPSVDVSARPMKRLKTFAKKAGIAALGGVTVGAVLFSSLLYSAPDF